MFAEGFSETIWRVQEVNEYLPGDHLSYKLGCDVSDMPEILESERPALIPNAKSYDVSKIPNLCVLVFSFIKGVLWTPSFWKIPT